MAGRRTASAEWRPTQPVKAGRDLGGAPILGSHSAIFEADCNFFRAKEPIPVALSLDFDTLIEGGSAVARAQLNQDTLLIRAQDPNFARCWFSFHLDFGAASGNPAFWVLEKTARDRWLLRLRRIDGDLATYHLRTRKDVFPLTLKKGRVSKEFTNWPRTITVSWAQ